MSSHGEGRGTAHAPLRQEARNIRVLSWYGKEGPLRVAYLLARGPVGNFITVQNEWFLLLRDSRMPSSPGA